MMGDHSPTRKIVNLLTGLTIAERIALYVMTSMLLVKVIFEFGLGHWFYTIEPIRQWFFFTFLAFEYSTTFFNQRRNLTYRPFSLAVIGLSIIMCCHGIVVGLYNENNLFDVFNDTVPVFCIALTVALAENDVAKRRPDAVRTFVWVMALFAVANYTVGFAAVKIGRPSIATIGGGAPQGVVFCVLAAALAAKIDKRLIAIAGLILAISIPDMNRTTLAFMTLGGLGAAAAMFIRAPVALFVAIVAVVFAGWVIVSNLPPDSRLVKRIEATSQYNPAARTGAIGERQAEADAIKYKLEDLGPTAQLVGLGHGAVYSFQSTWKYVVDSGHAHFGWALFNLRYGKIGMFYLVIFSGLLLYSFAMNISARSMEGYLCGCLALLGLLYVPTWFTFNLMIAGLQFIVARPQPRPETGPRWAQPQFR